MAARGSGDERADPFTAEITGVGRLAALLLEQQVGGLWSASGRGFGPKLVTVELPGRDWTVVLTGTGVTPDQAATAARVLESARPLIEALLATRRSLSRAQAQATIDGLTGVLNRLGWDLAMEARMPGATEAASSPPSTSTT